MFSRLPEVCSLNSTLYKQSGEKKSAATEKKGLILPQRQRQSTAVEKSLFPTNHASKILQVFPVRTGVSLTDHCFSMEKENISTWTCTDSSLGNQMDSACKFNIYLGNVRSAANQYCLFSQASKKKIGSPALSVSSLKLTLLGPY